MGAPSITSLRESMQTAFRKGSPARALPIALELEKLEPDEGRWPQQAGEALRKMDQPVDAAAAFERAARAWARAGFVARAIAMGKTITQLDPTRTAILDELDPVPARRAHRRARPAASALHDVPASLTEAAPVLEPLPVIVASEGETRPASERPLRFSTVPPAESITLDLSELDVIELSDDEIFLLDEDDASDGPENGPSRAIEKLALLPGFPLFAELPPAGLARLGAEAELVELGRGETVLRRGEPAEALYAIVEGAVRIRVPGIAEAQCPLLGEGDVFGEACLTPGHARLADVVVEKHLTALRITRTLLDELSAQTPEVGRVLAELLGRRLLANVLATATFFAGFDRPQLRELASLFELRKVPPRLPIVVRGRPGDGLMVVLSGRVELERDDGSVVFAGVGALVGRRAILGDAPSDVTARAPEGALVLRLAATRFGPFAARHPMALAHIASLDIESDGDVGGWGAAS